VNVDLVARTGAGGAGWVAGQQERTCEAGPCSHFAESTSAKCRDLFRVGKTDRYGHFTLHSLRPDEYPSMASADVEDAAYSDPDALKRCEGGGRSCRWLESRLRKCYSRQTVGEQ